MVIAVNIKLQQNDQYGYCSFFREIFKSISSNHPTHKFYFLSDKHFDDTAGFPSNLHTLVVGHQADNLLRNYWQGLILRKALKETGADLVISTSSSYSSGSALPQLLFISEENIIDTKNTTKTRRFFRKLAGLINRGGILIVPSEYAKKQFAEKHGLEEEKICVICPAAPDIFGPTDHAAQSEIKLQHTGGQEFFLFAGCLDSKDNLVNLLKAFSVFKKRQQTSMKLVLASENVVTNSSIPELLRTYKYKDEIVVLTSLAEYQLSGIVAASYAIIYPSPASGIQLVQAFQSEIPLLTIANPSALEIAADAALYFNAGDHSDLAEKLMLVYKDEVARNRLIENGKKIRTNYTMQKAALSLWQLIEKTCA